MRCKASDNPMVKHKQGLWSPDEDQKLTNYLIKHGHDCWSSVPINAGLQRNGKSCRLRWVNYLRPGLKRGAFSSQEEETILILHGLLGNKWSLISKHLPGRTDNEIKNYWHSQLKKKQAKSQHLHEVISPIGDDTNSNNLNTSKFTNSTLSVDMDRTVPPVSQSSHLPKVLFADWISLDEFQHDFVKSSNQPVSYGSNYQLSSNGDECKQNEGSTTSSETKVCSYEDMLHAEMTIDQIFSFDGATFDIDDFMYM